MKHLDLNLLRALDALLTEENVSKAAVRLQLTQPAVSALLGRLRIALGDPLLIRGAQGMVATPRAKELIAPVKQLLRDSEVLFSRQTEIEPGGLNIDFKIAATEYMQHEFLPILLHIIKNEAPKIRFSFAAIDFEKFDRNMELGYVDLSITEQVRGMPRHHFANLYEEHFVCAARHGNPYVSTEIDLERFCAVPQAIVSGNRITRRVEEVVFATGRTMVVAIGVNNYFMLPDVVANSDMIAVLPSRLAARHSDRLAVYPLPFELETFTLSAFWHERTHHDAAHSWIRKRLVFFAKDRFGG